MTIYNYIFILMTMFFLHVVEDFSLQGIKAQMKQKSYWENYDKKYHDDWIPVLFWHSFEWSFLVMLPLAFACKFNFTCVFFIFLFVNTVIHYIIDDLKCNKFKINLATDQFAHIIQILVTWAIMACFI